MQKYYLVDMKQNDDGIFLDQKAELTEAQKKEIEYWFSFSNHFDRCQTIRAMALESGDDFLSFIATLSSYKTYNQEEANRLHLTANKLLINFLSFLTTLYDVMGNSLSKQKGKEELQRFHKFDSQLYDEYFAYRFLKFLRNYVTHYDIPLSGLSFESSGISIFAVKSQLSRNEKWRKLGDEANQLPEKIEVFPYVEECKGIIDQLYLNAIEPSFQGIYQSYHQFLDMCKQYHLSRPALIIADDNNLESFETLNLPVESFLCYFQELNRHPNYSITVIR